MRALLYHGPGDLRVEEVPRPEPGPGDVLVQVEVALTDGTDAKAFRRGHPLLLAELPSPFGHEFCGIDVATGRRVVAANSAPCGECAPCRRGDETLCENLRPFLNGAYAEYLLVPERIAGRASDPRDDIYGYGRVLEDVLHRLGERGVDVPDFAAFRALADVCIGPDERRPASGAELLGRLP